MWALWTAALGAELVVGTDAPTVQETLDLAQKGDTVVLPEGRWPGPARVDAAITLTSRGGTLVGTEGKTLTVAAAGARVSGLQVHGSGDDLRGPDCCLYVEPTATGAVIEDSSFTDCLFGIWLHEVRSVQVRGNHVVGRPEERPPTKGNGIHLFDSDELIVEGNTVEGARDGIYVSATNESRIAGNRVSDQRFGIHYMYANHNVIAGNEADHNTGGIALMQSHHLTVIDNLTRHNERHGILFRDTLDSTISGNRTEHNGEGMFFFSSVRNQITDNVFAHNQIGVRIWAGTVDNEVHGNSFVSNREQVFYVASSDQHWGSNHWSDYLGWDQDGDGTGDRPYRNDAFTAQLLHRFPAAVLLLSSPSLELLAHMQERMPALRVPTVIDDHPLVARPEGA